MTLIGYLGVEFSSVYVGMDFDVEGTLYIGDSYAGLLYKVNTETAEATFVRAIPKINGNNLENMGFKVLNKENVNILRENALFSVNLINANVKIYPLICDECKKDCKEERDICIVLSTKGWSTFSSLNQKDLLILSKIYALANLPYEELPIGIKNQIKNILFCPKFSKK